MKHIDRKQADRMARGSIAFLSSCPCAICIAHYEQRCLYALKRSDCPVRKKIRKLIEPTVSQLEKNAKEVKGHGS